MEDSELWALVTEIFVDQFKVPAEAVTPEADLFDDLELDSLDLLTTVSQIEERFDIEVPDEELAKVRTVGSAVEVFQARLAARA